MKSRCSVFIENVTRTVGKRTEVDRIMTLALTLQRIFGHQVLDPKWTWKNFYPHQILTIMLIIYVTFGTLEIIKHTKDAELIAEAGYTLVLISTCPVKLFIFIMNRFHFRNLYDSSKTVLFDLVKEDSVTKISDLLKQIKILVNALFGVCVIPVSIYEISTLWHYIHGRYVLLSQSTSTLMPMTTPYYEIAWFLHTIFMTEMTSIIIVMDMWFVFLMMFLCSASEALAKKITLEPRTMEENREEYARRLNNTLREFYVSHIKQIEYINSLNKMYKWLGFLPLCNAAMCICIVLLVLSKEINWHFAPHILPLMAEVLAYNWFGEQLKSKVNALRSALLKFDWMGLEVKDRKSYSIIVLYMQKEFCIKIANGSDLCLVTMSSVFKASYQAFTVLNTINN